MSVRCRRGALSVALALLLAACGITPSRDGAPLRKLNPAEIKNAVPRREPISSIGNKSPYTVLGRTYVVLPTAKGYHATGIASWYGTKFNGQRTSDGEIYNLYAMTAASKTLPIPCYVLVTNLENNRQAIVRVNDRGPFVANRLIDLSYAAAVKLGFAAQGTAPVEISVIDVDNWPPHPAVAAAPAVKPPLASVPTPAAGAGDFYVQAGAFGARSTAQRLRAHLAAAQNKPVRVQPTPSRPVLYRVRIGPLRDRTEAERLRAHLLNAHLCEDARVVEDAAAGAVTAREPTPTQ